MKNDLTCGVVRDLLPSYVEGLTSPESNTAVSVICPSVRTVPSFGRRWQARRSRRPRRTQKR